MKRNIASSSACLMTLMTALSGAAYAQSSPTDDIRESNDPERAAEVERKAEAISGQTFGGSGEREEERSESGQPVLPSDESYRPGDDRSSGESGESGESEGGSEEREEDSPTPYSPSSPEGLGGSGTEEMGEGGSAGSSEGGTYEGEIRDSGPADLRDPYY